MASILKVDEMQGVTSAGDITITSEGGSATQSLQQGLAKAWVNFYGTGTIAARDSHNVSSLTDNSTGYYRTNLTSAMSSADFHSSVDRQVSNSINAFCTGLGPEGNTTSRISQYVFYYSSGADAAQDEDYVYASAHGDLA